MATEPKRLVCPYCGADLWLCYAYTGGPYSDYREVESIDCEGQGCYAEWDARGNPTKLPE